MIVQNDIDTIDYERNSYQNRNSQSKYFPSKNGLPLIFKGMILNEIFYKNSERNKQNLLKGPTIEEKRVIQKQCLLKWLFKINKQQILRKTLENILCQQKISHGSLFYRLKRMINIEQENIEKQKNRELRIHQQAEQSRKQSLNSVHKQHQKQCLCLKECVCHQSCDNLILQLKEQMKQQFTKINRMIYTIDYSIIKD